MPTLVSTQSIHETELDSQLEKYKRSAHRAHSELGRSHAALHLELGKAAMWRWAVGSNGQYLRRKYRQNDPPIDIKQTKRGEWAAVVRLIFQLTERENSTAVNKYASVLEYVDRSASQTKFRDAKAVAKFIREAGGIDTCIAALKELERQETKGNGGKKPQDKEANREAELKAA